MGDRVTDKPLSQLGGTAVFTKEIETALFDDVCDIAVHSLKDLATAMPEGLTLAAYLPREDARDVFISRDGASLKEMPEGASIGTSSLRRVAMVRHFRPDLKIVPLRGNVPTRLGALGKDIPDARPYSGPFLDGTIMAAAGLKRLELDAFITEYLSMDLFAPAPGQGVIALQTRADDEEMRAVARGLDCANTRNAVVAERTFLNVVEGGCRLPIGAFSTFSDTSIELTGVILSEDGETVIKGSLEGESSEAVGKALAEKLLAKGGRKILDELNQTLES